MGDPAAVNAGHHNGITIDAVVDFDVKFLSQATSRTDNLDVIHLQQADNSTIAFATMENPSIQVGETAYFSIRLKTPNDLIKMQVDSCQMINNHAGEFADDPPLSYEFITGNCPDIYTNTKIIPVMNGDNTVDNGEVAISFTMFEFIDAQLQPMALQNNSIQCSLKICAKDPNDPEAPCPGSCPARYNLN